MEEHEPQSNTNSYHCMWDKMLKVYFIFAIQRPQNCLLLNQIIEADMFPLPERSVSARRDVRKVTEAFPGISFHS